MERLEQKQIEKLKLLKLQKANKQTNEIRKMLDNQHIFTVLNFCKQILAQPLTEPLTDYSPSLLSKFIFQDELQKAKAIFDELPDHECTLEHFLLMMIQIMKFPFEKWPYYLVGLKDMFNEIVDKKAETINYQSFFKYVIGEVLDLKQQVQNTQFQVRFQQLKKQDYLLHDNGIKKFYYSNDLKYFMALDDSSPSIKIYNKEMRMVTKFSPNKQKHNKKYPNILHFDFSQMSGKLGIILSDSTFSIINFSNFISKSRYDFDILASNEIVVSLEEKMNKVYFIQMLNKWVFVSDLNKIYIFDYEKYKQNDPMFLNEVKLQDNDLKITLVYEVVALSMICIVTGNQVAFFNENFTEVKHSKFVHGTNIKNFIYCDQLGQFFLSGDQKFITIMSLNKATDSHTIHTFDIQSKIQVSTFEVFPSIGTIVAVDRNYDVRLFDLSQGTCYQLSSYSHIVKKQHGQIKMLKISKTQFSLYQTYNLVFNQQKIAIQRDAQFAFLRQTYYDQAKEQFYFSVNSQIISFSVFQGEIRKSFNLQTANVPKHQSFIIGKSTNLFVIDQDKYIYEVYLKGQNGDGQNKSYKKKIGVSEVVQMFYDQQISYGFVVGPTTIHTIRNDKYNNFVVTSTLNLEQLANIKLARYNYHQKYLVMLTENQTWVTIDLQKYSLRQYYHYKFPKEINNHEEIIIQQFQQDEDYNIDIILNNQNEIFLIAKESQYHCICIRLQDFLPYKLRSLQFKNMKYSRVGKPSQKRYLMLSDSTGYLIEINVTNLLSKHFETTKATKRFYTYPLKDLHQLSFADLSFKRIQIKPMRSYTLDRKYVNLFKGHDKEIKVMNKINVEGIRTLTISVDGHMKLWEGQQLLFHLKLPDLKKLAWNMQQIEKIKNNRSINQVIKVLTKISSLKVQKQTTEMLLKKNNQLKLIQEKKINLNDPIQIDIEHKEIQELVQKTQDINWYTFRADSKKRKRNGSMQTTNYHPWRTKPEFKKIMDKASPDNKYAKKIPLDLVVLRNSLDMRQRTSRFNKQYEGQLTILPQINSYILEKNNFSEREKEQTLNSDNQNQEAFESCLYVKNKKDRKKINEFDEIDKEFKKKWLAFTARKWLPKSEQKRSQPERTSFKGKGRDQKKYNYTPTNQLKYDPIKQVKNIFENHNRQVSIYKKGHFIKIPDIKLKREDLFNND